MADRLGAMRGPGEDYSAVILRIAAQNRKASLPAITLFGLAQQRLAIAA